MALDFWFVTHFRSQSYSGRKKLKKKKQQKSSQIPPEFALPTFGAKFNLMEVRESFLMVSIRRTLVINS